MSRKGGAGEKTTKGKTHIERQSATTIDTLIPHDTDQRLTVLEESGLERDDDKLHAGTCVFADVAGETRGVCVVERGVDFVEDEKG